ncbi:MAG TPA: UDP-N-acetylglucosamine 2-epimerase (non-hydrolyzing) [Dehalococcoidia bacterium]|nr:UDP-N-acetylglucosamine 2-epimerase (non-hydrolyzing) [Dehalococcoidia bacterium]
MKVILICGARPNFVKVSPVLRAIRRFNQEQSNLFQPVLVHTGQHYDYEMSQLFFNDLELPQPDIYLGIGSGSHAEQTGKIMIAVEKVLLEQKPDLVTVVGDVNSTLAAALAAVKLHIPLAHIEAGLRSYRLAMAEEVNRRLTDHISHYLFTTSRYDDENLRREGIAKSRIFRVGNIMVDSLLFYKPRAEESSILSRLKLKEKCYALVTLHRPENVDNRQRLSQIGRALRRIASEVPLVFPVHPRTRNSIISLGLADLFEHDAIKRTAPLGYLDLLNLEMNSRFVITDSGGIQVETTVLGIPCLTVLDSPVWTITHRQGTNILVGSDGVRLVQLAFRILDGRSRKGKCPELWDGRTAERILGALSKKPASD